MVAGVLSRRQSRCALFAVCSAIFVALAGCQSSPPQRSDAPADGTRPLVPPDPPDSLPCKLDVVADLAVRASSDHIYVDADVNGEPVTMILDTGADNTTLSPQAAKRLGLEQTNWPDTTVVGIGGAQKAAHFQADGLRIGMLHGRNFSLRQTRTVISQIITQTGSMRHELMQAYLF